MIGEVFLLLNKIKARALSAFRLTLSEIDIPDCDFEEAERLANPITASSDEDKISSIDNKEFGQFLNENLSSKNTNK